MCGIKLRHAIFQSDISNKIADNLGYVTDAELRYELEWILQTFDVNVNHSIFSFKELQKIDPSLSLENVESSRICLRTWIFDEGEE